MPGSGKSYIAELISKELNAKIFSMGDIVRDETRKKGLELTIENIENIATQLRKQYGNNAIAILLMKKIENLNDKIIIIDGVRGLDEIREFKKISDVCLIAVHASPQTRFARLNERKREGKSISWEEFEFRDRKNLEYGIGNVIALADFIIINEDDLKELEKEVNNIVEVIRNEKWKNYCRGGA